MSTALAAETLCLDLRFFSLIAAPETRRAASLALAKHYGAADLLLFDFDPEIERFLPSMGFPQTLHAGRAWRDFLNGEWGSAQKIGDLQFEKNGHPRQVMGLKASECIFVFLEPSGPLLPGDDLRLLAKNLASILKSERLTKIYQAQNANLAAMSDGFRAHTQALEKMRTELQEAYRETKIQKEHLHSLFLQAPAIINIHKGAKQTFDFVHPLASELFGRNVQDLPARSVMMVEDHWFIDAMDLVFQTGKPIHMEEIQLQWRKEVPSFEKPYFSVFMKPWRRNGEHVSGVMTFAFDVTERVKAKARLEESQKELLCAKEAAEAANEAKSSFLATMSHEIRTPLGVILGFSKLLQQPHTDEERVDYLKTILRNGEFLLQLINDILDLSKIEAGKMELECVPTDVVALAEETVKAYQLSATAKQIKLALDVDETVPNSIASDPKAVRQILVNLIGNAIKFTQHGSVRLRVTADAEKQEIAFFVEDTGIGLCTEQIARLFKPFYQADSSISRKYGGTGLGLVLSQKLAQGLGGDVVLLKSAPDEGCTFLATLHLKPMAFKQGEALSIQTKVLNGQRVLVAEDLQDNQRLVKRILIYLGLEVEVVENGQEALNRALTQSFDLVLMDLQMPVMDGITATYELRKRGYTGAIIALTANAMKDTEELCLNAGFDGFLTKPLDIQKLRIAIENCLFPVEN